jgi:Holliday junction resolvase RusA-like endonuclease
MEPRFYLVTGINPEPWVASEANIGRGKGGKSFVHFHKPTQLRNYQEALASEFPQQNPFAPMMEGDLQVTFYFWRRLEVGELDGRKRRAHIADATNLMKATEDALQGILYENDKSNRSVTSIIVAQGQEVESAIVVEIAPFDKTTLVHAQFKLDDLMLDQPEPTSNVHEIDDEVF